MNICVLGWYGTETLGDRAILAGIVKIFDMIESNSNIYLGSLYPFFTKRTLIEESELFTKMGISSKLQYYDVYDGKQLKKNILKSDIVIMGGGPLMDLIELDIIEKSFMFAKKNNIKTAVIGCGVGPLGDITFKKSVYKILKNSDLIIFRDKKSVYKAYDLGRKFGSEIKLNTIYSSFDPAIIPVGFYIDDKVTKADRIVINFRDLMFQVSVREQRIINDKLIELLKRLSNDFEEVWLLPNHVFSIGGDDRLFFSKLKLELEEKVNLRVIHEPQNLAQTFEIINTSKVAIAMRYHAILFQTLLNGNNYILDYTDLKEGKIKSFIEIIDTDGFYSNKYYNLSSDKDSIDFTINDSKFYYDRKIYSDTLDFYVNKIKELFND